MPDHVRDLVGGKRLLLWKEILADYNYPDTSLIDEMAAGFRLSGWMGKSNVFKARAKRPSMPLSTLKQLSRALNASTLRSMDVRQEPQLEAERPGRKQLKRRTKDGSGLVKLQTQMTACSSGALLASTNQTKPG
jgi:hypothetical protein